MVRSWGGGRPPSVLVWLWLADTRPDGWGAGVANLSCVCYNTTLRGLIEHVRKYWKHHRRRALLKYVVDERILFVVKNLGEGQQEWLQGECWPWASMVGHFLWKTGGGCGFGGVVLDKGVASFHKPPITVYWIDKLIDFTQLYTKTVQKKQKSKKIEIKIGFEETDVKEC